VFNRGDTPLYHVIAADGDDRQFGPVTLQADDGLEGGEDQVSWDYVTYPHEDVSKVVTATGKDTLDAIVTDQDQDSVLVEPLPDADGDGIPDVVEIGADPAEPRDTNGDGIPDYQDLDSDGDGIPDSYEAGPDPQDPRDSDGDGTPDYRDLDSDDDGIHDAVEAGPTPADVSDTDGDGTPDCLDLDSDEDGIPDAGEWSIGAADALAGCTARDPICYDNDADDDLWPNYLDPDSDGDERSDITEGLKDSDEDGVPDWLDALDLGHGATTYSVLLPFVNRP
jgi:hypothetical protein